MVESKKAQTKSKKWLADAQAAIGASINQQLKANGETMQSFAKRTGINPAMLTGYRRGSAKDPAPSLENLIKIKNGLGISYDELLGYSEATDFNGRFEKALKDSSNYTDNGKPYPLTDIQKSTIKRIVYGYLNINDSKPQFSSMEDFMNAIADFKKRDDQNG